MHMKPILLFYLLGLLIINIHAMKNNDHINSDTLTLKGKIVKESMENKKGQKLEGVQDYYFASGNKSYFIKTVVGNFSKQDLDKIGFTKEITIQCILKTGTWDIGPDDPSYAATRTGEYIIILEILK